MVSKERFTVINGVNTFTTLKEAEGDLYSSKAERKIYVTFDELDSFPCKSDVRNIGLTSASDQVIAGVPNLRKAQTGIASCGANITHYINIRNNAFSIVTENSKYIRNKME